MSEVNVYRCGEDLHNYSAIFRNKLYEVFALIDDGIENKQWTPVFTSEFVTEESNMAKVLLEEPQQLIKFKNFKRNPVEIVLNQSIDRRLTRVKNQNSLPIGSWAHWVSSQTLWLNFMLGLIIINSILIGVSTQMSQNKKEHYLALQLILWFDEFALVMFVLEIILKWIDNFTEFWKEGWNVFDFVITLLSAIPELILLFVPDAEREDNAIGNFALNLRVFRILRALKILGRFDSLKIIIRTILHALKSLSFIMMLLFIIMYIFAIIAVNIYEQYVLSTDPDLEFQRKFQNLGEALITLFQIFTLDRWFLIWEDTSQVANPVLSAIYILLWVWIGGFVFRNIFVGVIVNHFHNLNEIIEEQNREAARKRALDKMKKELKSELHRQSEVKQETEEITEGIKNDFRKSVVNLESQFNLTLQDEDEDEELISSHSARNRRGSLFSTGEAENLRAREEALMKLNVLMTEGYADARKWGKKLQKTILAFNEKNDEETEWRMKDILSYFSNMEMLMENIKEYEHLQALSVLALHNVQDT